MVFRQGAILLIQAKAQQVFPFGAVHMEEGVQVSVQVECGREEVSDGEKHG